MFAPVGRLTGRAGCLLSALTRQKHTLPALPYGYKALEPVVSGDIMELHYTKHHATYVNNLNAAQDQLKDCVDQGNVSGMIAVQGALRFNGGGHVNHSIFWTNLSPNGGGEPKGSTFSKACKTGALRSAIDRDFGSYDNFKTTMSAKTVAVQGSGWGWLGFDKGKGCLGIATCANQDPLQATTGLIPLLGIDVWEHAYYLQYKNVRPEYVKAIWEVVNWEDVAERYEAAQQ